MADNSTYNVDTDSSLFLVYGPAAPLRRRATDDIVAAVLPGQDIEWALVRTDGGENDLEQITTHFSSGSLMADARAVLVKNVHQLTNADQKKLAEAVRQLPAAVNVILDTDERGRGRSTKPDVAADLRRAVENVGQTIDASPPSAGRLPKWVAQEVRAQGKKISGNAARTLVEIIGSDAGNILSEIDKLITYAGEKDTINAADVDAVVCGQGESSIFDLVDAIGERDAKAALAALPHLLPAGSTSGAAMPIIGMIARQLRLVWQAKVLMNAGVNLKNPGADRDQWEDKLPDKHNFFTSTKGRGFLVKKYSTQARNFSDVQLVRAFRKLHETDITLKGQTDRKLDDRLALERLIVSLCRL